MAGSDVAEIIPPRKPRGSARGRPSEFSQEWADKICDWIANGGTLTEFCTFSNHPSPSTVFGWLRKDDAFSAQYARARECLADYLADETLDIADTPEVGRKIINKGHGTVETHHFDMIDHRRLRVATRQWAAGVIAPRKYGAKQQVEHKGSVGTGAQAELTPEQAERLAREMLIGRGYEFD